MFRTMDAAEKEALAGFPMLRQQITEVTTTHREELREMLEERERYNRDLRAEKQGL